MKRALTILLAVATGLLATNAQVASHNLGDAAEWTVGIQAVYGTQVKMPGVGIHFKTHYLDSWRSSVSGNYYFKKDGVNCYDVCLEGNYIFDLSDKVRLYPIAGGRLAFWHTDDVNGKGWPWGGDDKTHYQIGFNLGGGIDYLLGNHWVVNGEVKYQYLREADQVQLAVALEYRF